MPRESTNEEWRAAQEYWTLLAAPVYRGDGVARGAGKRVLVLPGLFGNDFYLHTFREWLARIGYVPLASSIHWNVGCPKRLLADAERPLVQALEAGAEDVAVIGHSRGGLLAKALTSKYPDRVRHLIVVGSPLGGMMRAGRQGMAHFAQYMTGDEGSPRRRVADAGRNMIRLLDPDCNSPDCDCEYTSLLFQPLSDALRVTGIYSEDDPIVPPAMSVLPYGDNIRVNGTHSGLMFNAEVYPVIAAALAM